MEVNRSNVREKSSGALLQRKRERGGELERVNQEDEEIEIEGE